MAYRFIVILLLLAATQAIEGACSSGFTEIGGRCYIFSSRLKLPGRSQNDGRIYCQSHLDADLGSAGRGGASEADPLLKYIFDNNLADNNRLYLGVKKTGRDQWTWQDGRVLSRDSYLWIYNRPNAHNVNAGDCVAVYAKWGNNDIVRNYMADTKCHYTYDFVCEKEMN